MCRSRSRNPHFVCIISGCDDREYHGDSIRWDDRRSSGQSSNARHRGITRPLASNSHSRVRVLALQGRAIKCILEWTKVDVHGWLAEEGWGDYAQPLNNPRGMVLAAGQREVFVSALGHIAGPQVFTAVGMLLNEHKSGIDPTKFAEVLEARCEFPPCAEAPDHHTVPCSEVSLASSTCRRSTTRTKSIDVCTSSHATPHDSSGHPLEPTR